MMKNYVKGVLATAFLIMHCTSSLAVNFTANGLTYTVLSAIDLTCGVSQPVFNEYSGDIVIPSIAQWGDTEDIFTVTEIMPYAFAFSTVTSVTMPNTITQIGAFAFSECTLLENIVIPNSVTKIDTYAFYNCSNLREITIGSSVRELFFAFNGCEKLETITMLATTPPNINVGDLNLSDDQYLNITLRVPEGTLEAYRSAPEWANFYTIEEFSPTGITNVESSIEPTIRTENGCIVIDGANGRVDVYDVSGALLNSVNASGSVEIAVPSGNIYIVKAAGKTVKVMM